MHSKTIIAAVMAMGLATAGSAFADNDRHHDNHRDDHGRNSHSRHGGPNHYKGHDNRAHNERGAGPHHDFRRGGRISSEYRNRQYVVNDWRGHRLQAPPRGYNWVQTGPDYVLIAVTTGIIAQIVLGN